MPRPRVYPEGFLDAANRAGKEFANGIKQQAKENRGAFVPGDTRSRNLGQSSVNELYFREKEDERRRNK